MECFEAGKSYPVNRFFRKTLNLLRVFKLHWNIKHQVVKPTEIKNKNKNLCFSP